ncbi:MAG: helix-turn-helix domain-containing protein [Actinomycetota bacterium]|nr:helix-turn-helix domain-containing protein [Actinomycetota bacterium]
MGIDDEARTIGRRVRRIRHSRGKSLVVIAGLAGMSKSELSRIERGERALDSRSKIVALANALQVAPSELIRVDVPAPGNGVTDVAVEAVRVALMAVNHGHPGGDVLPVEALREQVGALIGACSLGDQKLAGHELPVLIRNLHTSITAGRDVAELLDLATLLHTQATIGWLRTAGASVDLREQAALLARQAAQERDTPTMRGLAAAGAVRVMLSTGAFDLAQAELDSVAVPATNPQTMQLAGMLALYRAEVAAADSRPGDVDPALEHADELAERTGEGNAYWLGFGPTNTGFCRTSVALDLKDYDRAVTAAESVNPQRNSNRSRQAAYWVYYGRALARRRSRHDDAVQALRRAELIVPHRVQRDPFARDVLAELLARSQRDAVGRELRGMAYRAGLPV